MVFIQTETFPQTLPLPIENQPETPVFDDVNRYLANLDNNDGFADRFSLKQDICAGMPQVIHIDKLSSLSPCSILEDYIFWFNLCAARGVKIVTADRVFDLGEPQAWRDAFDELGYDVGEKEYLASGKGRKNVVAGGAAQTSLLDNPPPPYVTETSLGGVTVDFVQLNTMEKVWSLAERYSMADVAGRLGLPVSVVRRALCVERLLFCQGLWLDSDTGALRKGYWPALMSAERAGQIIATLQRNSGRTD